ncbi:MAG: VanZ family protein [Oscillospiraceae bacterium]
MKIYRALYLILSIIICCLIFSFSSQTGAASEGLSVKVTDTAVEVINTGKERVSPSHESTEFQQLHIIVRKLAHFCIYLALGFSIFGFVSTFALARRTVFIVSVVACFMYACSDEFHQSFIFGRGPAFFDVSIDVLGALLGIAIIFIAQVVMKRHKEIS